MVASVLSVDVRTNSTTSLRVRVVLCCGQEANFCRSVRPLELFDNLVVVVNV